MWSREAIPTIVLDVGVDVRIEYKIMSSKHVWHSKPEEAEKPRVDCVHPGQGIRNWTSQGAILEPGMGSRGRVVL